VQNADYVAWVSDQDAYAASGQKCSAQSILFAHENWVKAGIIDKIATLAKRRKLDDLTIGPILTWDNAKIKAHIDKILAIPGTKLSFGGNPLKNHSIPAVYGAFEPTAVEVPLDQFVKNFDLCSQELFGPFQLIVPYSDKDINTVI
jgi:1-pyrroline-5-carboxylate dehydrogenase